MPLPDKHFYTSEDYWSLPEGERAELIDGELYAMAPPSYRHQKLISEFTQAIGSFIKAHDGSCEVIPAPFAVNLDADDKNWVEPDINVICDQKKLAIEVATELQISSSRSSLPAHRVWIISRSSCSIKDTVYGNIGSSILSQRVSWCTALKKTTPLLIRSRIPFLSVYMAGN
jgi:hypothetical protein